VAGHLDLENSLAKRSHDANCHGSGESGTPLQGACGKKPDLVIVVLDASALGRSLVLLAQVIATGARVVAAVTMRDIATRRSVDPDLHALADAAGVPVVAIDPRTGQGSEALADTVQRALELPIPAARLQEPEEQFDWSSSVLQRAVPAPPPVPLRSHSDRIDSILLHPVLGILIFFGVLWGLLEITARIATPLIDGVAGFVEGPLADLLSRGLEAISAPNWVISLLTDGVLTGVGTVLSFTPLLALLFLAIGVLEDSGYLARAAFIADRALRRIGLDGRAMIPLVIGFGCNVPAVTATRTMPDARRRLLTGLLIPLAACPARLAVFVLIAAAFFPGHVGTVVFLLYLFSVILIALGGLLLKHTVFRDLSVQRPLVLALPAYQVPRLGSLLLSIGRRVWSFIKGAGGIIAGVLVAVWLLTAIPATAGHSFADVPITDSVFARGSQLVSPVLAPAGLDDWRVASSLVTGIVAKEVVVGNLALTFGTYDPTDDLTLTGFEASGDPGSLEARLQSALHVSSNGHATAAAAAFMVIVLAYTPCVAAVAEQKRQFGLRWALIGAAGQAVLAWVLAVLVFQVGRLL
jgi:ferrous iron transport protein B